MVLSLFKDKDKQNKQRGARCEERPGLRFSLHYSLQGGGLGGRAWGSNRWHGQGWARGGSRQGIPTMSFLRTARRLGHMGIERKSPIKSVKPMQLSTPYQFGGSASFAPGQHNSLNKKPARNGRGRLYAAYSTERVQLGFSSDQC